jgi:hypothetical protein
MPGGGVLFYNRLIQRNSRAFFAEWIFINHNAAYNKNKKCKIPRLRESIIIGERERKILKVRRKRRKINGVNSWTGHLDPAVWFPGQKRPVGSQGLEMWKSTRGNLFTEMKNTNKFLQGRKYSSFASQLCLRTCGISAWKSEAREVASREGFDAYAQWAVNPYGDVDQSSEYHKLFGQTEFL